MGCCIQRKKCITVNTMNKKSTQIKTTQYEKTNKLLYLNKSLACLELQKYYLPIPIEKLRANTFFNKEFSSPFLSQTSKNEKNKKKIKRSMDRLKNLSLREVNNCPICFNFNTNCNSNTNNNK